MYSVGRSICETLAFWEAKMSASRQVIRSTVPARPLYASSPLKTSSRHTRASAASTPSGTSNTG